MLVCSAAVLVCSSLVKWQYVLPAAAVLVVGIVLADVLMGNVFIHLLITHDHHLLAVWFAAFLVDVILMAASQKLLESLLAKLLLM